MSAASIASPSSIATAQSAAANAATDGGNPYSELSSSDFLQIMLTELSNQDPFEPNDSQAILEQLSSLRSIESDLDLQEQLESLVLQNAIGQAGALIGKQVEGLSLANDTVQGTVVAVNVVDGKAELELDTGIKLSLERVGKITDPLPETPAAGLTANPPSVAIPAGSPTTTTDFSSPEALTQAINAVLGGESDADSQDAGGDA